VSEQTPRRGLRRTLTLALLPLLAGAGVLVFAANRDVPAAAWPKPFDPGKPLDLDGVPGVSDQQRRRAADLVARAIAEAPRWSSYEETLAAGWYSFGDEILGYEHVMNPEMYYDGVILDPRRPESLVYKVTDGKREFVAYMFMADADTPRDDPSLLSFAGPLIEWHNHEDVCVLITDEYPIGRAAGFKQPDGSCEYEGASTAAPDPAAFLGKGEPGTMRDVSDYAMTHVWVVAHPCGPFSALEGDARGSALVPLDKRRDVCDH